MKKFVYLVQCRDWQNYLPNLVSDNSDCVALFWDKSKTFKHEYVKCLHYSKNLDGSNSSWNQGRNALYNYAKCKDYEYFIFLDDDIVVEQLDGLHPFRYFELMLNLVNPACAVGNYDSHLWDESDYKESLSVQTIMAADAIFYAMHRDAAKLLLPYPEQWDKLNWWRSQNVINQLAMTYYKGDVVQFNKLKVKNKYHIEYPTIGKNNFVEIEELIYSQLPNELKSNWAKFEETVYKSHGEVKCNGDYKRDKTIFID